MVPSGRCAVPKPRNIPPSWNRPSLEKLIPERFRAHHAEHVHKFGTTGVTSRRMGALNVIYGLRASGEEFPIDASISQLDTPSHVVGVWMTTRRHRS